MNLRNLIGLAVAALTMSGCPELARAAAIKCEPVAVVTPVPSKVLAVLVDRTALRDDHLNRQVHAVVVAAAKPGVKVALWIFGGARPLPSLEFDHVMPSLPPTTAGAGNLLGRLFKRSGADEEAQKCAQDRFEAAKAALAGQLSRQLEAFDNSARGSSPILFSMTQAIRAARASSPALPLSLLMISDGIEHTSKGLSFYGDITPTEVVLKASALFPSDSWKGVSVYFAGLGLSDANADAVTASALEMLWRALIVSRDGEPKELSTSSPMSLTN